MILAICHGSRRWRPTRATKQFRMPMYDARPSPSPNCDLLMPGCDERPRVPSMKNDRSRCTSAKIPSSRTPARRPRRRGEEKSRASDRPLRRSVRSASSTTAKNQCRLRVNSGSQNHDARSITPHCTYPRADFSRCQSPHSCAANPRHLRARSIELSLSRSSLSFVRSKDEWRRQSITQLEAYDPQM
jgi:hypothetical protein